ncbi:MAG: radical SAM protein [Candidatus Brocadiales bacterium]
MKVVDLFKDIARTSRAVLGASLGDGRARPFILSHLITNRCNADCPFCVFKGEDQGLSTEEVQRLYRQAGELGFLSVVVWGGEPLLREDLPEVLQAARSSGLSTTVITNGYYLPERFQELGPYLDAVTVSLDAVGEEHDAIRCLPGTFRRATEGIKLIRSRYKDVRILINSVITRLNTNHVSSLLKFSRENDLPIMFEPITTWDYGLHPRGIEAQTLLPSQEESLQVAKCLIHAKARGFPVVNSYEYLSVIGRRSAKYRCRYKHLVLRVEADGRVMDCIQRGKVVGDTKESALSDILHSPAYRGFLKKAQNCSACVDSATIESSFLWELRPSCLLNALRFYKSL